MKTPRKIYHVIRNKGMNRWEVVFYEAGKKADDTPLTFHRFKFMMILVARRLARRSWFNFHEPSQVLINNRLNIIKTEWSYGCDSKAKG